MELARHLLPLWPMLYQCVQCHETNHNHCFPQMSDLCSGVETVPWICSCSVCFYRAEGGTDFGKTPIKPRRGITFGGCKFWGVEFIISQQKMHFNGCADLESLSDGRAKIDCCIGRMIAHCHSCQMQSACFRCFPCPGSPRPPNLSLFSAFRILPK